MSRRPTVSVLITVHNRERLIEDAIRSSLAQTMSDLEVIVVDDGSIDGTASVVESIDDPRLKLIRHSCNQGIPAARNSALDEASGEYVAWLDSDDLSRPDRLERQLLYLRANPSVAMVGSCAGKLLEDGTRKLGIRVPPLAHDDIRCWLLFRSAFQQSSVFGRREILRRYPYRAEFPVCEDVDMFVRLSAEHQVANLPEVLIDRRLHPGQTIRHNRDLIVDAQSSISAPLLDAAGVQYNAEDLRRHVLLGGSFDFRPDAEYLAWVSNWLSKLIVANDASEMFDRGSLRLCASFLWIRACGRASNRAHGTSKLFSSRLTPGIISSHGRAWLSEALPLMRRG